MSVFQSARKRMLQRLQLTRGLACMPHAPSPQRSRLYFAVIRAGAIAIRKRKRGNKERSKTRHSFQWALPPSLSKLCAQTYKRDFTHHCQGRFLVSRQAIFLEVLLIRRGTNVMSVKGRAILNQKHVFIDKMRCGVIRS